MLIVVSRIGLKDVREIVWKVVSTDEQEVADKTVALISHKGKVNATAHLFCAGYALSLPRTSPRDTFR